MPIPIFLQPCLASYDLSQLDINRDKKLIITEVLNKGSDKAVKWLLGNYKISDLKKVVENPSRGMWLRKSLSYWQKVLELDIPKDVFELAVLNFDPDPKLYQEFFGMR